jgi:hypothetical protein
VPALVAGDARVGDALEAVDFLVDPMVEAVRLPAPQLHHALVAHVRYIWLICSHICELICSRTWRAFSRAAAMQLTMELGLSSSKVSR